MAQTVHSVIESLGVYLPSKIVSTDEVLAGCVNPVHFPLQDLTGIASRRVAGAGEYSIVLAQNAIADCLAHSRHNPQDIDLIVCTSISRFCGPRGIAYEPCIALGLARQFDMMHAQAFDVTNACAGMFTGIYLVDALIRIGAIRRGLVVSGEYITHLTDSAQQEVSDYMDPRLACLTLGDAGAAVILEAATADDVGFHAIELYTVAKYVDYCIAKPSGKAHGGAIMMTDSIAATAAALKHCGRHAAKLLQQYGRPLESIQHVIPHQTSKTTIKYGLEEIARSVGRNLDGLVINNLAERGNTASNTHFIALRDQILNNTIRSGDSIVFCFSGSGMTVGTALYTFDDLPHRLADGNGQGDVAATRPDQPNPTSTQSSVDTSQSSECPRVQISAMGTTAPWNELAISDTRELLRLAGEACLEQFPHDRGTIDLVINVSIYRTDFIAEPAIAVLAAADLKINQDAQPDDAQLTVAFDLDSGSTGFLTACRLAVDLIRSRRHRRVMVLSSEIENNALLEAAPLRGLREVGSAVLLEESQDGRSGFGRFLSRNATQYYDDFTSVGMLQPGGPRLVFEKSPHFEEYALECIAATVGDLLEADRLQISNIDWVFPPQISPEFVRRLSTAIGIELDRFVDIACEQGDLFNASVPCAIEYARQENWTSPGDVGLMINVGAGIQVVCAIYHF